MAKQSSALEWKVLLPDAEWDREESLDTLLGDGSARGFVEHGQKGRLRRSHVWAAAFTALVIIGVAAYMMWREARAGVAQIESELASAVDAEAWREQANVESEAHIAEASVEELSGESITSGWHQPIEDRLALAERQRRFQAEWANTPLQKRVTSSQPAGPAPIERVELGEVALRAGLAMVEVTTVDVDGNAFRETQFYREEYLPNGFSNWQRTSPSADFWGAELDVETTYFHFWYRVQDAEAVEAAAVRLDAIYAQLHEDVGLPFAQDRLDVYVLPELPAKIGLLEFKAGRLEVTSPKLLRVPMELSDGEALLKPVVHALVTHVMSEAMEQGYVHHEWVAMARGLQVWQVYVGSDITEPWYQETVAWLYDDAPEIRNRQRELSTEDLWILCREFYTWQHALSSNLALLPLCMHEKQEVVIRNFLTESPDRLDQLLHNADWDGYPGDTWFDDWARSAAAATVVDYVVQAYGREYLPALISSFRTHSDWKTLIPEVLGVSAEEFEADWLRFWQIEWRTAMQK